MPEYRYEMYGQRIAGIYDEWYAEFDQDMVDLLGELAGGGRALELGIGTGRVALPLQESGLEVHGIDASEAMLARLRAKPGGERIPVTTGSFADVAVEGKFSLVYVVFSTFFALLTQEEQVRCFKNVARRLDAGGAFLIEAFVPDLARFDRKQTVRARSIDVDEVHLEATRWDPLNQQIMGQYIALNEDGILLFPVKLRLAWPAELDLMAQLAGLRLWQRWETWQRAPFTGDSQRHISVYKQA